MITSNHSSIAQAIKQELEDARINGVDPLTFDLKFWPKASPEERHKAKEVSAALVTDLEARPRDRQEQTFRQSDFRGVDIISLDRSEDHPEGRFHRPVLHTIRIEENGQVEIIQRVSFSKCGKMPGR